MDERMDGRKDGYQRGGLVERAGPWRLHEDGYWGEL